MVQSEVYIWQPLQCCSKSATIHQPYWLNKKDKNRVIKVMKNYIKDNEKEIKKQKQSLDDLKKLLTEEEWFFS